MILAIASMAVYASRMDNCWGPECVREGSKSFGLCEAHYHQKHRTGEMWPIGKKRHRDSRASWCVMENCDRPNYAYGLCSTHNSRKLRGYPLDAPLQGSAEYFSTQCRVTNCPKMAGYRFDVCMNHRNRARKFSLSDDQIVELFAEGQCAACGADNDLNIHHDHGCCNFYGSCGKCVVAVLCGPCNRAAGQVGDDPDRLYKLAEVLRLNLAKQNSAHTGNR